MQTQSIQTAADVKLARCLWCKLRIGEARYRLQGRWQVKSFNNALAVWLAGDDITDGICPECFEEQLAQLGALRLN